MRILRTLPLLAVLLLWLPAAAHAQTLTVDSTLNISGTLGTGATPFTRHVTLTLTGGTGTDAKTIQNRRSDLTKEGSNEVIDRGNVSVAAASLKPGQTMDVAVTVNNVTRAGTYTGTIKFWLPEQTEANAQVVKLTLQVGPRIVVSPPTGSSAHVAHCGIFPCSWSGWLPQNLIGNKRGFLLDNQTVGNVKVDEQEVTLRGERSGHILTEKDVRPIIVRKDPPDCGDKCLPSSHQVPIELEIVNRDAIPPDSYVGGVRFGLVGTDSPAVVAYTLNVRRAPWWPLVVLLIGVIVGRIIKNMSTPEALLQVKLLKRLFRIQDSVFGLRSDGDRNLLIRDLDELKERIESGRETELVLTQELDKLEVTVRLLRRLEALKEEALRLTDQNLKTTILTSIEEATVTLLKDDAAKSAQIISEIEQSLRAAQTDTIRFDSALDSVLEAKATGEDAAKVFNVPPAPQPGRPERVLAWLAGSDLIGAGARFWVLRPIFFLLLLFLLTLIGLKSLYIDNGPNFGVGGIYDYLGLFLWGLSAQVVQNTLQNVSLPRP